MSPLETCLSSVSQTCTMRLADCELTTTAAADQGEHGVRGSPLAHAVDSLSQQQQQQNANASLLDTSTTNPSPSLSLLSKSLSEETFVSTLACNYMYETTSNASSPVVLSFVNGSNECSTLWTSELAAALTTRPDSMNRLNGGCFDLDAMTNRLDTGSGSGSERPQACVLASTAQSSLSEAKNASIVQCSTRSVACGGVDLLTNEQREAANTCYALYNVSTVATTTTIPESTTIVTTTTQMPETTTTPTTTSTSTSTSTSTTTTTTTTPTTTTTTTSTSTTTSTKGKQKTNKNEFIVKCIRLICVVVCHKQR